jgi:hypothetical protein
LEKSEIRINNKFCYLNINVVHPAANSHHNPQRSKLLQILLKIRKIF